MAARPESLPVDRLVRAQVGRNPHRAGRARVCRLGRRQRADVARGDDGLRLSGGDPVRPEGRRGAQPGVGRADYLFPLAGCRLRCVVSTVVRRGPGHPPRPAPFSRRTGAGRRNRGVVAAGLGQKARAPIEPVLRRLAERDGRQSAAGCRAFPHRVVRRSARQPAGRPAAGERCDRSGVGRGGNSLAAFETQRPKNRRHSGINRGRVAGRERWGRGSAREAGRLDRSGNGLARGNPCGVSVCGDVHRHSHTLRNRPVLRPLRNAALLFAPHPAGVAKDAARLPRRRRSHRRRVLDRTAVFSDRVARHVSGRRARGRHGDRVPRFARHGHRRRGISQSDLRLGRSHPGTVPVAEENRAGRYARAHPSSSRPLRRVGVPGPTLRRHVVLVKRQAVEGEPTLYRTPRDSDGTRH